MNSLFPNSNSCDDTTEPGSSLSSSPSSTRPSVPLASDNADLVTLDVDLKYKLQLQEKNHELKYQQEQDRELQYKLQRQEELQKRKIERLRLQIERLERQGQVSLSRSRNTLQVLGEGSFGTVYHYPTHSTVYKTCGNDEGDENLHFEFTFYSLIYTATGHGTDPGSFWTPRAWAYWRPSTSEVMEPDGSRKRPSDSPRTRRPRSTPPSSLWSKLHYPTFLFDLVPSIPQEPAEIYEQLFIAENIRHASPSIRLLRLYLGRDDLPLQISAFQEGLTSDLPLDIRRYNTLRDVAGLEVPTVESVARGMGELLSRLHWVVGINGRDIELVLGSVMVDGKPHPQCYVLDFNQCQRWLIPKPLEHLHQNTPTTGSYASADLRAGVKRPAMIISGQELYYPRPHQTEVYPAFKRAYLDEVGIIVGEIRKHRDPYGWGDQIQEAAEAFFTEFEALNTAKLQRRARIGTLGKSRSG